jgi:AcrR family transcriptional regulator
VSASSSTTPAGGLVGLLTAQKPERRDAAEHRQQVLAAAARLFNERGVENVTMDEIAHAAGVGKGTLYRRYADKGQLVLALMDACVRHLEEVVAAEIQPADRSQSALTDLEAVLERLVLWIEEHVAWLGVLSDQAAGRRRGAVQCGPLYRWLHGVLVGLLERAVADGEAAIDDCVYTADALLALLDIDLYLFQRRERGYTPEQIGAGLRGFVRAMRSDRSAGGPRPGGGD